MKLLYLIAALALVAPAAAPKRDWKLVTVKAYDDSVVQSAPRWVVGSPNGPAPPSTLSRTWREFRIEGNGYLFRVKCQVRTNHTPDVTINGQVKYAMEKGRFYMLDDSGKEWEMTVVEKNLVSDPTAPPKN